MFPSIDMIGDFPLKSTYAVPFLDLVSHGMRIGDFLYLFLLVGCRSLYISIISNAVLFFSLVLRIPCFFLFMWPSSVVCAEFGIYFWTARDVKLGHVEIF